MANNWLDLKGPIVADTVYDGGKLRGKDVSFTLPGLEFLTADVQAMGTMTVPLPLLNNMQLSISKSGLDGAGAKMSTFEKHSFEFRWAQNVVKSDGSMSPQGCKAFVRTLPSAIPELGAEIASAPELEYTYNVTRVQLYMDGTELYCVDRLANILRINGKDYMNKVNNLL